MLPHRSGRFGGATPESTTPEAGSAAPSGCGSHGATVRTAVRRAGDVDIATAVDADLRYDSSLGIYRVHAGDQPPTAVRASAPSMIGDTVRRSPVALVAQAIYAGHPEPATCTPDCVPGCSEHSYAMADRDPGLVARFLRAWLDGSQWYSRSGGTDAQGRRCCATHGSMVPTNMAQTAQAARRRAFSVWLSGGVLLSHTLAGAVPSALEGLASGFGMGPGVSPPLWPP